jgi:hypothetical protein
MTLAEVVKPANPHAGKYCVNCGRKVDAKDDEKAHDGHVVKKQKPAEEEE